MFGFRDRDGDNGGGFFAAMVVALVVLIAIAYFLFYVFLIILGIIGIIACIIGAITTLKNFIVAFIDRNRMYSGSGDGFIKKMFLIFGGTFLDGMAKNFTNIKDLFSQSSFHKVFSFKKWLYIFSAISILIFGTLIAIGIMIIPCSIFSMIVGFIFMLMLLILVISSILAIVKTLYLTTKIYVSKSIESYNNSGVRFIEYYKSRVFSEFLEIIKDSFIDNFQVVKDSMNESKTYDIINIKRWYYFFSSIIYLTLSNILLLAYIVINGIINIILFLICLLLGFFIK